MQTGVGLKVEWSGTCYSIIDIVRKSAAHSCKVLRKGDYLISVDGIELCSKSMSLSSLMLGLPGTHVEIGYKSTVDGPVKYVNLIRGEGKDSVIKEAGLKVCNDTSSSRPGSPNNNNSSIDDRSSRVVLNDSHATDDILPKRKRIRCVAMLPGDSRRPRVGAAHQWVLDTSHSNVPLSDVESEKDQGTIRVEQVNITKHPMPEHMSPNKGGKKKVQFSPEVIDENLDWITVDDTSLNQALQNADISDIDLRDAQLQFDPRTPEAKMLQAEMRREQEAEAKSSQERMGLAAGIVGGKFGTGPKCNLDRVLSAANDIPPVGSYEISRAPLKLPGGRFGTAKRFAQIQAQQLMVGPGQYSTEPIRSKSCCRFGASERSMEIDQVIKEAQKLPGPGEYFDEVGPSTAERSKSVAKVHHSSHPPRKTVSTPGPSSSRLSFVTSIAPGPGAYDVPAPSQTKGAFLNSTSVPRFLGAELARAINLPGPADYTLNSSWRGTGGKFSLSITKSDVDIRCQEAQKLPGPGAYRPRDRRQHAGFSMSKGNTKTAIELAAKSAGRVPGPGQYTPEPVQIEKNSGRFSSAPKCSLIEESANRASRFPGPGEYGAPSRLTTDRGAGKFGTAPKQANLAGTSTGPGPGAYEVPYALPPPDRLPKSEAEWQAFKTVYPEMRFR